MGLLVTMLCIIGLWRLLGDSQDETAHAEKDAAQSSVNADAATQALEVQCRAGIRTACHQIEQLDAQPAPEDPQADDEVQDPEIQEPEVQEPEQQDSETQDPERQNPETQQPEIQDPETQNPESQDGDPNDDEIQDPEKDDPDPDDPESQDPEIDDPDPNSLLSFQADDSCSPGPNEMVTDVSISVTQTGSAVTYTLTCTTVQLPAQLLSLLR